ncbi:MFS transporter [Oceanospirillum sanctuarii]|uniref:MFS transporter n=1 Tax=Oceanospirillum sanctuarii TaxID=1434821 RepID=UPI000A3D0B1E|nr:MFS transporter [Oceanospirillum sanctuarii]
MLLGRHKSFTAYWLTQFFGAFNDNVYKNTLLILFAYGALTVPLGNVGLVNNLAAAIFILPFLLFSSMGANLAIRHDHALLMRRLKMAECGIMLLAALMLWLDQGAMLLLLLFLMGTQSALFGPVKYSVLPAWFERDDLISANGWVELGTFLAILLGTLAAGILLSAELDLGVTLTPKDLVAITIVLLALIGFWQSRRIEPLKNEQPSSPQLSFSQTMKLCHEKKEGLYLVWSISWFWFVGATLLTQLPAWVEKHLAAEPWVFSLVLGFFAGGVGVGSLSSRKLHAKMKFTGVYWLGSALIAVGMLMLIFSVALSTTLIAFSLMGIGGGCYAVPLYTRLQQSSGESCAWLIAANNIYNAIFMITSAVLGMVVLGMLGQSIAMLIGITLVLHLLVVVVFYIRLSGAHSG